MKSRFSSQTALDTINGLNNKHDKTKADYGKSFNQNVQSVQFS